MFIQRKPLLGELTERLMAMAADLGRGDLLLTEAIEQTTGCVRYEDCWSSLVRRLKRAMLDRRGIALWPVVGLGFKLCTRDEQLNFITLARQKRAGRQLSRSLRELRALPAGELSDHQRRIRALKERHILDSRRLLKRQVREQKDVARRSETTPQIASFRQPTEAVRT